MSVAGLAKASTTAMRRLAPSSSFLSVATVTPVIQHSLADKGLLPGSQVKSTPLFSGGRFKAGRNWKTGHEYATSPAAVFCPCRTYSSTIEIPCPIYVKSLRPSGCRDDRLLTFKELITRYPLFRRLKGHPLIPDEDNVWVITAEGGAFFDNFGWFVFYNNEQHVYIGDCLDEELLRFSERFLSPELGNDAKGYCFGESFGKHSNYNMYGRFIIKMMEKYYPEVKWTPEFREYVQRLYLCTKRLQPTEEETLLSNAALLPSDAAVLFLLRADLWVLKAVKFRGNTMQKSKRNTIMCAIAEAAYGDNGEPPMDIIKKDPYLNHPSKVLQERADRNTEYQKAMSRKKGGNLGEEKKEVEQNPVPELQKKLCKEKAANMSKEKAANLSKEQKPVQEVQQLTEKQKQKKEWLEQIRKTVRIGDDVLGAQRHLIMHGFDDKLHNDPEVVALNKSGDFTSAELMEYLRWKLRRSLVVIQESFEKAGCNNILGTRDLLSSLRRGTGLFPSLPSQPPSATRYYRQPPAPTHPGGNQGGPSLGFGGDNRQGAGLAYGGDNRRGTGPAYGGDILHGGYGQYSSPGEEQQGNWQMQPPAPTHPGGNQGGRGPNLGFGGDNRQGAEPAYGGDNRWGAGPAYGGDNLQGGSGQYSSPGEGQQGNWQGRQ